MARQAFDVFSIAVCGRGRLLGPFVTEAFQRFKSASIYMRDEEMNAFRRNEVRLGKSNFASKEFRKLAQATEKSLKNPEPVDVTVTFRQEGDSERVWIRGKLQRRILSLRWAQLKDLSELDKAVAQVVDAVGAVS